MDDEGGGAIFKHRFARNRYPGGYPALQVTVFLPADTKKGGRGMTRRQTCSEFGLSELMRHLEGAGCEQFDIAHSMSVSPGSDLVPPTVYFVLEWEVPCMAATVALLASRGVSCRPWNPSAWEVKLVCTKDVGGGMFGRAEKVGRATVELLKKNGVVVRFQVLQKPDAYPLACWIVLSPMTHVQASILECSVIYPLTGGHAYVCEDFPKPYRKGQLFV